ncbi:MAG: APC family permease [Acidobacteriaceae bacterium]|nr:APC family permease [Acidobacteriaceae bacterium]MBV9781785.1 APC family permease [Acidobacteriaceae bacterium]
MSIIDFLIGRPIASSSERAEQIGVAKGIPIFGLDALSSAAYGPEAALTLLIPLAAAGLAYILPLSLSIIVLLIIVFFSYRQTIAAYPQGGGSYTVARENLGTFPGLLAAAALLIDYVLTAAVGISAGIGALTSAIPSLHPRTLTLCLVALALLTLVNLRGVRETGAIFMLPTYAFLACMFIALGMGAVKSLASGGQPSPIVPPPAPQAATAAVSAWLLLKAFASGCTALTGVEAVSNGVKAFRDPAVKYARRTLAIIIAALIIMLAGIAYLVKTYKIVATDPNGNDYRSILSMMLEAVTGRGWFYYAAIASILLVLIFSANTAFADFPRVCRFISEDGYLPISFANRGRRLVYSEGILVLALITGALLIIFGGITDRLIPLYAVGAFLAFTMSQAGMVAHWRRERGEGAVRSMVINGLGALATGLTVLVVIVAKFTEGAWITVIMIPGILVFMYGVKRHYSRVLREIASRTPLEPFILLPPIIVITIQSWTRFAKEALHLAMIMSKDIRAIHVAEEDKPDEFCGKWDEYAIDPARKAQLPVPELVVLKSPYRFVVSPIVDYVIKLAKENPNRRIVAVIPELVEKRWYYYFLHSQRAALLKTRLLMQGNDRISVLNIPWYLK